MGEGVMFGGVCKDGDGGYGGLAYALQWPHQGA